MYDLKRSHPAMYNFVWSVRSCCDKQEVRCHASLNLSHLRYGCQRCTLAVTIAMTTFNFRKIFKRTFKIYGIWSVGRSYTHTSAQCSPASVGLAQARPNYGLYVASVAID